MPKKKQPAIKCFKVLATYPDAAGIDPLTIAVTKNEDIRTLKDAVEHVKEHCHHKVSNDEFHYPEKVDGIGEFNISDAPAINSLANAPKAES